MSETKQCSSCGTALANKRSHARTCSNTCRWQIWYAKQSAMISVKLIFSVTDYEVIKGNAEAGGVSVSDHLQAQATAGCKQ